MVLDYSEIRHYTCLALEVAPRIAGPIEVSAFFQQYLPLTADSETICTFYRCLESVGPVAADYASLQSDDMVDNLVRGCLADTSRVAHATVE
jgi:hypothetical protein